MTSRPSTLSPVELDTEALLSAGFQRIGEWRATPDGQGIALDGEPSRLAGVYAYAVDGRVHYVGSAQRGLKRRFGHYVRSQTMRTSQRIRGEIVQSLLAGARVEILALCPPALAWEGLPVDLVAGLEEGLIRALRPEWNRRSNPKRIPNP